MKHWQTSTLGILTILAAVSGAVAALIDGNPNTNPDWTLTIAAITSGIAQLRGADASKVNALEATIQSPKTP